MMNLPLKSDLYEQLQALPENLTGEILNNQLHTMPRPSGRHALAETALVSGLYQSYGRSSSGWWLLVEPEIHFKINAEIAVPDIAGWRRERLPTLPETPGFTVVPDWLGEMLSPSTKNKDRGTKMPLYARYGLPFVWLVDPLEKTLAAYELIEQQWQLLGQWQGQTQVFVKPFEGIMIELKALWGES
jgi:Uma2 family endonuclease